MNRRKVLIGLPLLIGGALISYPAFKWIKWNMSPNIDYLESRKSLIASLTDTIIPKTDSPGASDCGVHDFIIKMIKDCSDTITQNKFIEGMRSLEEYVKAEYGQTYQLCTDDQKKKVLTYFMKKDLPWTGMLGKVQNRYLGKSFFVTLKDNCIKGYCTSQRGATEGLRYSHIPSKYNACEDYKTGEKSWATS